MGNHIKLASVEIEWMFSSTENLQAKVLLPSYANMFLSSPFPKVRNITASIKEFYFGGERSLECCKFCVHLWADQSLRLHENKPVEQIQQIPQHWKSPNAFKQAKSVLFIFCRTTLCTKTPTYSLFEKPKGKKKTPNKQCITGQREMALHICTYRNKIANIIIIHAQVQRIYPSGENWLRQPFVLPVWCPDAKCGLATMPPAVLIFNWIWSGYNFKCHLPSCWGKSKTILLYFFKNGHIVKLSPAHGSGFPLTRKAEVWRAGKTLPSCGIWHIIPTIFLDSTCQNRDA